MMLIQRVGWNFIFNQQFTQKKNILILIKCFRALTFIGAFSCSVQRGNEIFRVQAVSHKDLFIRIRLLRTLIPIGFFLCVGVVTQRVIYGETRTASID